MTREMTGIFSDQSGYAYVLKCLRPKNSFFVTNNFIAELTLLYRCYVIWGRSKYLLVATGFLVLCDTVWGYLSTSFPIVTAHSEFVPVYLWSVFAINIIISGIAAGRIFWVSRIAVLEHRSLRHYRIIIAVLLESSAVYSSVVLCYILFPDSVYQFVVMTIGMRIVAIMPTLLIVQVGLDRIVGDSDTSDCEQPAASIVLDTVLTTGHEQTDSSWLDEERDSPYRSSESSFTHDVAQNLKAREG